MVEEENVIQPLKPVIRIANERDREQEAANKEKEKEAFQICLEKIKKHGLEMKLIDAEYTFDNNNSIPLAVSTITQSPFFISNFKGSKK